MFQYWNFLSFRVSFLANVRNKTIWRARIPDISDSQTHKEYDRPFSLREDRDFNTSPYILDEHIGHLAIWIVLIYVV